MNRTYAPEMRERALRMLRQVRPEHANMLSALRHVAGLLGMTPETLRLWQRRCEFDAVVKPGVTTDAAAEIKRLCKENADQANEILKAASVFSPRNSTAPERVVPWRAGAGARVLRRGRRRCNPENQRLRTPPKP